MQTDPASGTQRLHAGLAYLAGETLPMLLVLTLPAAILLGMAMHAGAPDQAAPHGAAGPYDGFTFEQVGVGVRRVVDDGAGNEPTAGTIAIAADGSLLTCCERHSSWFGVMREYDLLRLGERWPVGSWGHSAWVASHVDDLAVAPDGAVWTAGSEISVLREGVVRTVQTRGRSSDVLEVAADGAVWASVDDKRTPAVLRIGDGRAQTFVPGKGLPRSVAGWQARVTGIAPASDGSVWVGTSSSIRRGSGGLLRFDGESWRVVRPLGPKVDARVLGVATETDGTLWAYLSRDDGKASARATSYLARLDGSGWTVFDERDGVPHHAPPYARERQARVLMAVAPDGGVWLTPLQGDRCRSLLHFDGSRTRSYFESGACVSDLAVAADGTAWVSISQRAAGPDPVWVSGLYAVAL